MQDLPDIISDNLNLLYLIVFLIIILIFYFVLQRILSRFIKANENVILDDITSGIKFFARIITGYLIIISISFYYSLPSEIFLLLTALIGTIISLSSIQVINNFLAGIVIIILNPYEVNDFINIGPYEGRVTRITLNYTKILTINDAFVLIPNRVILTQDLTNFSVEQKVKKDKNNYLDEFKDILQLDDKKITRYSFSLAVPLENLSQIVKKIESVCENNLQTFGYKPSFFLINLGWKAEYQFVLRSEKSETIRTNLKPFRNQLLKTIYPA